MSIAVGLQDAHTSRSNASRHELTTECFWDRADTTSLYMSFRVVYKQITKIHIIQLKSSQVCYVKRFTVCEHNSTLMPNNFHVWTQIRVVCIKPFQKNPVSDQYTCGRCHSTWWHFWHSSEITAHQHLLQSFPNACTFFIVPTGLYCFHIIHKCSCHAEDCMSLLLFKNFFSAVSFHLWTVLFISIYILKEKEFMLQ